MGRVLYPTDKVKKVESIFLAGTIDMGNSIDWQSKVIEELEHSVVDIYNPRRLEWDASWEQKIENTKFNHQVTWELECLEKADLIIMYLAENSLSPISLLELGLHIRNKKIIIYCPEEFYREGNVDISSKMYGAPVHKSFDVLMTDVKNMLSESI